MTPRVDISKLDAGTRCLLYLRIRELATPSRFLRLGIAFLVVFGIITLAGTKGERFWVIAIDLVALGFLPFYALAQGGDAIRSDLREGTIEYLWTRPASRVSLFLGYYISSLAGILLFAFVCFAAMIAAGLWLGEIGSLSTVAKLAAGCIAASAAFAAISQSLGAVTSKFMVFGVIYYAIVEKLVGRLPTIASNASILTNLKSQLYTISEYPGGIVNSATLLAYANVMAVTVVALGIGAAVFVCKNYAIGDD